MIILLNGPLGIGKSTLAEALSESIHDCVMLEGDALVAANPPPRDVMEHLHSTIDLLVEHHRKWGYRHFVIDHIWTSHAELEDLRRRLSRFDGEIRVFLLTLSEEENIRRIERRAGARAIDERDFEHRTALTERRALASKMPGVLGEPLDVAASPEVLVRTVLERLGRVES